MHIEITEMIDKLKNSDQSYEVTNYISLLEKENISLEKYLEIKRSLNYNIDYHEKDSVHMIQYIGELLLAQKNILIEINTDKYYDNQLERLEKYQNIINLGKIHLHEYLEINDFIFELLYELEDDKGSTIRKITGDIKKKDFEKKEKINNYILSIDDERVKNTSFEPLKSGGVISNIYYFINEINKIDGIKELGIISNAHPLIIDKSGNYVFQVNGIIKIILFLLTIIAIVSVTGAISYIIDFSYPLSFESFFAIIFEMTFPITFVVLVLYIYYNLFNTYIFDFSNGYFYQSKYKKNLFKYINNQKYTKKVIPIREIHAVQIIDEKNQTKNSSFISYELNMILKDSFRVNIVDHGSLTEIRKNAEDLGNKLGVKVYDLTQIYFEE